MLLQIEDDSFTILYPIFMSDKSKSPIIKMVQNQIILMDSEDEYKNDCKDDLSPCSSQFDVIQK